MAMLYLLLLYAFSIKLIDDVVIFATSEKYYCSLTGLHNGEPSKIFCCIDWLAI